MAELIVHGGAQEVGRSCIEIATENTRILLDAGLKLTEHAPDYPEHVENVKNIDGVLLSHAHLDHCGGLPYFDHEGMRCPIYARSATKQLTKLILEDAFAIGQLTHQQIGYIHDDIDRALACVKNIRTKKKGTINEISFAFYDAGHIPGAAAILLTIAGQNILYTGDIKLEPTQLHAGADLSFGSNIHTLICEATYGDREHPDRKKTEREFIDEISQTLKQGGSVIIPVFALGRAQEILLLVGAAQEAGNLPEKVPYYLDGMAASATELVLRFPETINNAPLLAKFFRRARRISGFRERVAAVKKQGIFITTSGMLTGGPVVQYLKVLNSPRNSILLTGYQGEHTNGRLLTEEGVVFIDGWRTRVQCRWKQFDFSAHAGLSELKKLVRTVKPKHVIFVHGDPAAIKSIAAWTSALDITTHAPNLCDKIQLELGG